MGWGVGKFSWEFWGNFPENSGNFRLGPGTKIDILK